MKFIVTGLAFLLPVLLFSQKLNVDSMITEDKRKKELALNNPYLKISLKTPEGLITNDDFKGKVVYINFWHSQCAPCLGEMEAINNLYDSFSTNPKFKFLSLTFNDEKTIRKIKKQHGIKFPVYSIDGDECDRLMYNLGFPTNIIIGDSGLVKYIMAGASLNEQKNIEYFSKKIFPIIKGELFKP